VDLQRSAYDGARPSAETDTFLCRCLLVLRLSASSQDCAAISKNKFAALRRDIHQTDHRVNLDQ
jgi:hypothetical protein